MFSGHTHTHTRANVHYSAHITHTIIHRHTSVATLYKQTEVKPSFAFDD